MYLSDSVLEALVKYRELQARIGYSLKSRGYLEPRNLIWTFKALTKKANVTNIPFHNLRHTLATIMRMGENPKVVGEGLGHARVSITLDIYSHTNEEMQKNKQIDLMIDSGHNGQKDTKIQTIESLQL